MTDRIKINDAEMAKVYGPIDEIVISGCDVHLEQLDTDCFWLCITRGDEEIQIRICKRGKSVHAEIAHRNGFRGLEE